MFHRLCTAAVLAVFAGLPALAQTPAPAPGYWRCVMNSGIVSIDITYRINADRTLSGQGSIVYPATGRIVAVQGAGAWAALPPDQTSDRWLFKFQMAPATHAVFSLFAAPTGDPDYLYNDFRDAYGRTQTACQRIG